MRKQAGRAACTRPRHLPDGSGHKVSARELLVKAEQKLQPLEAPPLEKLEAPAAVKATPPTTAAVASV